VIPQDAGLRVQQMRRDRRFAAHERIPDAPARIASVQPSLQHVAGVWRLQNDAAHFLIRLAGDRDDAGIIGAAGDGDDADEPANPTLDRISAATRGGVR
jgi:hypothetical protein